MYVSAERFLIEWATARFAARVSNEPPSDLQAQLPVIIISRFGGRDVELTIDRADIDVDVYAATWAEADALAMSAMSAFRSELPGVLITVASNSAVVAKVSTISAPSRRPVTDSNLSRSGASYEVRIQAR